MRILIIEDDVAIAQTLRDELRHNYSVDLSHSGKDGIYMSTVNDYDVIILDLTLPDINGVDVCQKIRRDRVKTPVLILTGNDTIDGKVQALDAGADDYLLKPFSFAELGARIRALLRRNPDSASNILAINDLSLDINRRIVRRGDREIRLRRKEFDLLEYLMRNAGRVVTRGMMLEHVWDSNVDSFTNAIDVHIKYLRDSIDRPFDRKLIKTVHGLGYKIDFND